MYPAEYIISLWIGAQEINNNPAILPNHLLCLELSLSTDVTEVLSSVFSDIINSDVPAVVDTSPSKWSTIVKGLVLPHALPTVRYSMGHMDFATSQELVHLFKEQDISHTTGQQNTLDSLQKFVRQYFFTIGPDTTVPVKAICGLAKEFGWKQIGIVVADDQATRVDTRYVYIKHLDTRY